ncbi:histidine phosphatase family protein [Microvirga brassicacearum]|uniref:Histidine phosphatase family protein n=1 Tax=Microvirga brassicacearum TaxID=2580413 RepID=A0A5N3PEA3_9HYPH|nr:histidine phosphatase family protein [Microvirga brassicacearum]KAB0268030.1 histidine phosphatase family protein [Microvirga brassicacearum]
MKRLVLVRHGETAWNAKHVLQGQEDISLSPQGEQQAAAIAPLVHELNPQAAYASDLRRARETAGILGLNPVITNPAWREAGLGAWEGKAKAHLDPAEYQAWRAARFDPPGAEPWQEFRERIRQALAALPSDGTTVVVTHGGAIRAALSVLIGLEPDRIIPVEPGSLTVLDLNGMARLKAFNVTGNIATLDTPD